MLWNLAFRNYIVTITTEFHSQVPDDNETNDYLSHSARNERMYTQTIRIVD